MVIQSIDLVYFSIVVSSTKNVYGYTYFVFTKPTKEGVSYGEYRWYAV